MTLIKTRSIKKQDFEYVHRNIRCFNVSNMLTGKGVVRAERGYNEIDKNFYFLSIHYAIFRLLSISITSLGLMVFIQKIIYLEQKKRHSS